MKEKRDLYQEITDRIVALIEDGNLQKWTKPWIVYDPKNFVTGHLYQGIVNLMMLAVHSLEREFKYPLYCTFLQAKQAGGSIKKSEQGSPILYFKPESVYKGKNSETGEEELLVGRILRFFTVFNVEQTTLDVEAIAREHLPAAKEFKPLPEARDFIASIPAKLIEGGDSACYIPDRDVVRLPAVEQFEGEAAYLSAAFHEIAHWSGHESRLNRDLSTRFGDDRYAMEELTAELASAMLCCKFGVEARIQHSASYMKGWLKVLGQDKYAIFRASSDAREVVEYLHSFQASEVSDVG